MEHSTLDAEGNQIIQRIVEDRRRAHEYYLQHKEDIKQRALTYYAANKQKILERMKEQRKQFAERKQDLYANGQYPLRIPLCSERNKEKKREYNKNYYNNKKCSV